MHLDTSTSPSKYARLLYLYVCIFVQYTPSLTPNAWTHTLIDTANSPGAGTLLFTDTDIKSWIQIRRDTYNTHTPSQMDMGVTSNMQLKGCEKSVMASYIQIHCPQVN